MHNYIKYLIRLVPNNYRNILQISIFLYAGKLIPFFSIPALLALCGLETVGKITFCLSLEQTFSAVLNFNLQPIIINRLKQNKTRSITVFTKQYRVCILSIFIIVSSIYSLGLVESSILTTGVLIFLNSCVAALIFYDCFLILASNRVNLYGTVFSLMITLNYSAITATFFLGYGLHIALFVKILCLLFLWFSIHWRKLLSKNYCSVSQYKALLSKRNRVIAKYLFKKAYLVFLNSIVLSECLKLPKYFCAKFNQFEMIGLYDIVNQICSPYLVFTSSIVPIMQKNIHISTKEGNSSAEGKIADGSYVKLILIFLPIFCVISIFVKLLLYRTEVSVSIYLLILVNIALCFQGLYFVNSLKIIHQDLSQRLLFLTLTVIFPITLLISFLLQYIQFDLFFASILIWGLIYLTTTILLNNESVNKDN